MTTVAKVAVIDARRRGRDPLDLRIQTVRASLFEARAWIEAGLDGAIPLEEAACSADRALRPALAEVLREELS